MSYYWSFSSSEKRPALDANVDLSSSKTLFTRNEKLFMELLVRSLPDHCVLYCLPSFRVLRAPARAEPIELVLSASSSAHPAF